MWTDNVAIFQTQELLQTFVLVNMVVVLNNAFSVDGSLLHLSDVTVGINNVFIPRRSTLLRPEQTSRWVSFDQALCVG